MTLLPACISAVAISVPMVDGAARFSDMPNLHGNGRRIVDDLPARRRTRALPRRPGPLAVLLPSVRRHGKRVQRRRPRSGGAPSGRRAQSRACHADVPQLLNAATEGVRTRGKANLGDKTLLDALQPASEAFAVALSASSTRRSVTAISASLRSSLPRRSKLRQTRAAPTSANSLRRPRRAGDDDQRYRCASRAAAILYGK